uniref:Uncharacterized protein n=1 Tax=Candidatus Kentrum sp. TC TaxID=2126339 RepID=A0A450ZVD3_9GAMM|nr:MAG: hypothetical protein BECKTC1821F_GA0114240_102014 [Candidatus Kentron sp. TC]
MRMPRTRDAMEMYGDMENFPYREIMRGIANFEGRTRRRRRKAETKRRKQSIRRIVVQPKPAITRR